MRERNPLIDAVRIGSIAVVVFVHWFGPYIIWENGTVHAGIPLSGPVVWAITWLIQVMPLVFVGGGYANTAGVDTARARGESFLAKRAMRLLLPVLPLVALFTAVSTIGAGLGAQPLATVGSQVTKPLWFLAIYLLVVCLVPVMVAAHDRFGLAVPAALFAGVAIVDTLRFTTMGLTADAGAYGDVNFVLVWLTAHQLGIAYARGAFAGLSRRVLGGVVATAAVVILAMVLVGPYPPSMIGLPDVPMSNLAPPTLAMLVLSVAQVAVLVLIAPWAGRRLTGARQQRLIKRANPAIMSVYLWHLPAGAMLAGVALLAPEALLPDLGLDWWLSRPVWLIACSLALFAVLRVVRRVEAALPTVDSRFPLTGLLIAAFGIHQVTRHGLDLTTANAAIGVLVITAAVAVLSVPQRSKRLVTTGAPNVCPSSNTTYPSHSGR